jgi:hypothetical protein
MEGGNLKDGKVIMFEGIGDGVFMHRWIRHASRHNLIPLCFLF